MMRTLFALFLLTTLELSAQMPVNGLVGYWPFHGNAGDSSGYFNHGTVNGAVLIPDRFGNCNQAYRFNGVNNTIVVPNSTTINFNNSTDFSVAMWIKIAASNYDGIPLSKNQYGSWSGYQFFANTANPGYCNTPKHASFYAAAGGGQDACSNNQLDTNWHFFTGVYHYQTNQAYFYVDGVVQTDIGQRSGNISTAANLVFGSNTAYSNMFTGALDAIRIYNRALSASEITQLYNEPNPGSGGAGSVTHTLRDTTLCTASTITLQASSASSYTWSTGSHTQSIQVSAPGTYWVEISSMSGCTYSDTAHIAIVSLSQFDLISDTVSCSGSINPLILNESQANALGYLWSTGSTSSSIPVFNSGIYWVDLQFGACSVRDSATVTINSPPFIGLPADTFVCSFPMQLTVQNPTATVTWWNGDEHTGVTINQSGVYSVTVTSGSCTSTQMTHVMDQASDNYVIPNVFTPNGDGVNDYFEFDQKSVIVRDFKLYNRWGLLVYSVDKGTVKWDGRQKNGNIDDGVYYWTGIIDKSCQGATSGTENKKSGFVSLFK